MVINSKSDNSKVNYDSFLKKIEIYKRVFDATKGDNSKWKEKFIASSGLLNCIEEGMLKGYKIPRNLIEFYSGSIENVNNHFAGYKDVIPSIDDYLGINIGKKKGGPLVFDYVHLAVNVFSAYFHGHALGKIDQLDKFKYAQRCNPYVKYLVHKAREKNDIERTGKSNQKYSSCSEEDLYVNKVSASLPYRSFLNGYFHGFNDKGNVRKILLKLNGRDVYMSITMEKLIETIMEIIRRDDLLSNITPNEMKVLLYCFMYPYSKKGSEKKNYDTLTANEIEEANLIGVSISDSSSNMVVGANFAAIIKRDKRELANASKSDDVFEAFVNSIINIPSKTVSYDSNGIECICEGLDLGELNCYEYANEQGIIQYWHGLGEIPKELYLHRDNIKNYLIKCRE
jgi:hypothetical protein